MELVDDETVYVMTMDITNIESINSAVDKLKYIAPNGIDVSKCLYRITLSVSTINTFISSHQ